MSKSLRQPLTPEYMREIAIRLRQAFQSVSELKQKPGGAAIQYPKLPSVFSESLVVHCGPTLFPHAKNIRLGGAEADVVFDSLDGTKKVEVKATGSKAFQEFGSKDVNADFLVWVAFGSVFEEEAEDAVHVYVLTEPRRVFPDGRKITLAKFKEQAAGKLTSYEAKLSDLIDGKVLRIPQQSTSTLLITPGRDRSNPIRRRTAIPDYQSLMLPLLKHAAHGETRVRDVAGELADEFGLTAEERDELLPSGRQQVFNNRIHWAKFYMAKAGLIDQTQHGRFIASERGRELLARNPATINLDTLLEYPAFREFYPGSGSAPVESTQEISASDLNSPQPPEQITKAQKLAREWKPERASAIEESEGAPPFEPMADHDTKIATQITALALELIKQHRDGIRYTDLVRQISKKDAHLKLSTIRGNVWDLDAKFPDKVYKPSRGLFRLIIPQDEEGHCHGNSDSSAGRRRLASSDETDIV
jgi:Mrr N-terminal domain